MTKSLKVMMLYPEEMNIYGDFGNLDWLESRIEAHGLNVEEVLHVPGNPLDETADIVLGGGGQDSGQNDVKRDLLKNAIKLNKMVDDGVTMLMVCGMYQLFGHYFETVEGHRLTGIGVFDMFTKAGEKRLIGDIITDWEGYKLIGYENHSGQTHLNKDQKPFATTISGFGNNSTRKTEGARSNNAFGTYLHGPLLPKNPKFTDELIRLATTRKYGGFFPNLELDDSIATHARGVILDRFS
ncbi:MAG: glutamine amidotransferase [Candidatus Ancillula sp.]|jgi:CobQ-like glutamine amidotransferase family enzyme|nr:glutamine amidotransferase [Candidatus Ancillula sp.]